MKPSHSIVRTGPSEDGPARDSTSVARKIYKDDAHVRDSQSTTRPYIVNDTEMRDSHSTTRLNNENGARDGQSSTRVVDTSRESVNSCRDVATGEPEDTSPGPSKDSNVPGIARAEVLDNDVWKYSFGRPLPHLDCDDAPASASSSIGICLQSCELLTLRQYGHWQGRIEINGSWSTAPKVREASHLQAFKVTYSYRQWSSADVSRLICESSDHSLDIVEALKRTLCGDVSENELPVSYWVDEHCQPYETRLSRPFGELAEFLGHVKLEDGEATAEEYCIGEYRLPSKSKSLSREEVLRERMPEAVSRERERRDYLLL